MDASPTGESSWLTTYARPYNKYFASSPAPCTSLSTTASGTTKPRYTRPRLEQNRGLSSDTQNQAKSASGTVPLTFVVISLCLLICPRLSFPPCPTHTDRGDRPCATRAGLPYTSSKILTQPQATGTQPSHGPCHRVCMTSSSAIVGLTGPPLFTEGVGPTFHPSHRRTRYKHCTRKGI